MFNHNIHYYCTIDCISKINKTLSDNVAHLQKINLKLVLCPGDFLGSEKEDKKNIQYYYSVFFRVFFSCVYFFLEIYSSEYSPKAKIFSLKLLIMTLFGLRLILCLTRDEER